MSIRSPLLILILISIALYSSVGAAAYTVQPGDEISIILPGEESLSEPFMVDREGNILLPELGEFSVKGLKKWY
jgi:protein involved in polysaccharide export with SLBB domain